MKFWLAIACSISVLWAGDASPARIKDAGTRAVAAIQKSQKNWYAKQTCVSCHQQIMPALAAEAAREHGIAVDENIAHADAARAFGYFAKLDRAVEYTHLFAPTMNEGYGLLAAHAQGLRPSLVTAVYARLLASRQEADGHWDVQDQRPPQSYSLFTSTAIALQAIQLYSHPSLRADTRERAERAKAWLLSHTPGATEERAFQLLGVSAAGGDAATLEKLAGELKATQGPDGGWASLDGRVSDAYSTGEALVALNEAGIPKTDGAFERGIDYLLRTQAKDGTWHVVSRLHPPAPVSPDYFETGHLYGHDQFISAMGESWAVMALSRALDPVTGLTAPALREAEPVGIEPWAETLLFGSVAEVKALLDRGFNANSTTRSGGLTALMLATPDVGKMTLLIEHGANADARADNRYSALLVAAQYSGSTQAMELLLDHGATLRPPKGQGAALFNAYPTMLAAYSGNAGMVERLHRAGDPVDAKMNMMGIIPITPLLLLASTDELDSVRALLDAGGKVDEADDDGITLLAWAAISNRLGMAGLLIDRGADVNHVDKKGMTPLLYAASIDFGDSAMIDLLLKSGARADARTKEGLTARDLARKYRHVHLLASLQ